jgi:hypothetical protein
MPATRRLRLLSIVTVLLLLAVRDCIDPTVRGAGGAYMGGITQIAPTG